MAGNQELVDEIIDLAEIERQKQATLAALREIKAAIKDLGKVEINAKAPDQKYSDTIKNVTALTKVTEKYNDALGKEKEATEANRKAKEAESKASAENEKSKIREAAAAKLNAGAKAKEAEASKFAAEQKLAEARTAQILAREKERERKASERARKETEKANNAYEQLKKRYKEVADEAKRLGAALGTNNKLFQAAAAHAKQLGDRLKEIESAVGQNQRNVGNYTSAFDKLTGVIAGALLPMLSFNAAISAFKKIISTGGEFEALNASIKAIAKDSQDYAEIQNFLAVTADKYGQDIIVLTGAYKGLGAATRGTILEGRQTRMIFESVVKAGTALKLSNDQITGSLLALQQMISKGKVQAEELRGQLGERLPGAFRLFAEAIGVSEAELNKMLEKGEVIASETLPKFAAKLSEVYGDAAIKNANSLVNETNRLNNAFNALLLTIGETSGINTFWKEFKRGLTEGVKDLNFFLRSPSWRGFLDLFNTNGASALRLQRNMTEAVAEGLSDLNNKISRDQRYELEKNALVIRQIRKKMASGVTADEYEELSKQLKNLEQFQTEGTKIYLHTLQQEADAAKKAAAEDTGLTEKQKKELEKRRKAYEKYLKDLEDVRQRLRKNMMWEAIEGPSLKGDPEIEAAKKRFEKIKAMDEQDRDILLRANELAYQKGERTYEEYEKRKVEITDENNGYIIQAEIQFNKDIIKILEARGVDVSKELAAIAALELKYAELGSKNREKQRNKDKKDDEKWAKERREMIQQLSSELLDFAATLGTRKFELEKNAIQEQIDLLEEKKNLEIEAIESSTAAEEEKAAKIAVINAKAASERQRLELQQRKTEEKAARFQKAVAIAKAIADAALAVLNAIKTGDPYTAAARAAIVGAIGAVQVATIVAQPIPKYKHGTERHQGGLAILGDGGRSEVAVTPSGKSIVTPSTDTLYNLPAGTRVFPSLANARQRMPKVFHDVVPDGEFRVDHQAHDLMSEQIREIKGLRTALASQQQNHFHWDNGELRRSVQRGDNWTHYINSNVRR